MLPIFISEQRRMLESCLHRGDKKEGACDVKVHGDTQKSDTG